jgi:hypothetical protein
MLSDYYVIGGCILYIVGIGFCAYHCSMNTKNPARLECLYSEKDNYETINYSEV